MKAYDVALFFLVLNAAINVVNEMNLDSNKLDYRSGISDELKRTAPQEGDKVSNVELNTVASTFGMLISGIVFVLKILAYSTVLFPIMLNNVGIGAVSALGLLLTTVYWLTMIIGYVQFSSRSSIAQNE